MKRFLSILKWEVIRQFKNGIYYASIFMLVLWILLFSFIKSVPLNSLLPMIILSNLTMTTYFFMAGIMLFEKGEGSLTAQVTTPIKEWEYVAAKAISLSALATLENLIITIALAGWQFNYISVIAGTFIAGIIFCLVGFITVIRYDSINEFLIPSIGYMFLVTLPILSVFFLNQSWIWYLHPVFGTYKLIENGFTNIGPWNVAYGICIPLITITILGYFSLTGFTRFVVRSEGRRRHA
jgi:fluoroquinolone transport system permease protein